MLIDNIQQDLKQAQLGRKEVEVSTLRLLLSEIHNAEISKGERLSDAEITIAVSREVEKRKEAALGFRSGGRQELAQKEEFELAILEKYLPAQMSDEELTKLVESSINEVKAKTVQDMGKVIRVVMAKAAGQTDGGRASALVKAKLAQ